MKIRQSLIVSVLAFTMCTLAGSAIADEVAAPEITNPAIQKIIQSRAARVRELNQGLTAAEKELALCEKEVKDVVNKIVFWEDPQQTVYLWEYNELKERLAERKLCVANAHKTITPIRVEILSHLNVGNLNKDERDELLQLKIKAQSVEKDANRLNNTINTLSKRHHALEVRAQ